MIMMHNKDTKASVCTTDGDTDFFDIITGVLQGDRLVTYMSIICLHYVLWMPKDQMKENGSH